MGTMLASAIIGRAQRILNDTTGVRWGDAELLDWLNDAQREIVLLKPDASVTNTTLQLATGTKQSIPSAGIILHKVTRNMGTDGTTPGRAIWEIDQSILNQENPGWHTDTDNAEAKHYMFDSNDPKTFYVYPPQPASSQGYVELVYSSAPTDIANTATAISIDDVYANSMLDYLLYRAYSKDTDYAGNAQRAAGHQQAFAASLGGKEAAEKATESTVKVGRVHRGG